MMLRCRGSIRIYPRIGLQKFKISRIKTQMAININTVHLIDAFTALKAMHNASLSRGDHMTSKKKRYITEKKKAEKKGGTSQKQKIKQRGRRTLYKGVSCTKGMPPYNAQLTKPLALPYVNNDISSSIRTASSSG